MVTSSAVVGSSAMTSLGWQATAMAIITPLPHAAGELVGVLLEALLGVGDVHALE